MDPIAYCGFSCSQGLGFVYQKEGKEMENISLIELNESYLPQMAELMKEAFGGEPWNDDWSDAKQLSEYV